MMAKAKNRMMQGEFTPGVDPGLKAWLKMREDVRNSRLKGSNQYTITSDISYKLHYHWIDILHSLNEESFQKLIKTNQISDADLAKANHKNLCTFEEFEEFLKEENPDIEKLYYYAIQHRSLILLNVLFEREKYDVNRLLTQKRRPILHLAVIHGELEKVRFLLEHGANATICDIDNRSALHFAMQPDSSFHPLEIPSLLIQHGADVNTQDKHGRTPLHYACLIKSPNLARLLLQNGADMTIEDEKVKTPLNYNHNAAVLKVFSEFSMYQGRKLQFLKVQARIVSTQFIKDIFQIVEPKCITCKRTLINCSSLKRTNYRFWMHAHGNFKKENYKPNKTES